MIISKDVPRSPLSWLEADLRVDDLLPARRWWRQSLHSPGNMASPEHTCSDSSIRDVTVYPQLGLKEV